MFVAYNNNKVWCNGSTGRVALGRLGSIPNP